MQKQLIALILFLLAYCYAYEWEHIYTATGEYEHFNRLFFFSPDTGFAVGYGVTATTDGGKTWTKVTDDITFTRNITFTDRKHGFACGDGFIRRTGDGGNSWKLISLADSVSDCHYKNILFLDTLTGFLAGGYGNIYPYPMSYGRILKTVDGGNTWKMVLSCSEDKINDIVVDPQSGHLYAAGGQNPAPGGYNDTAKSWVAKSYDKGETWKIKSLNQIKGELTDIQFIDSNNIITSSFRYFCKLDSALNLKYCYLSQSNDSVNYYNINFFNKDTGFIMSVNTGNNIYPLYSTSNGGLTWTVEIKLQTHEFRAVFNIDTVIYAATGDKLFKTYTTTSINHFELNKTDNLLTCYPNPFNPTTNINYTLNKAGVTNLSVYNAKGELVSRLYQGTQLAGEHRATFNATGLNSGVYFVKLTGEKINVNKKVLLIK